MTTINAMKLNDYSGICICDEQRSWNPEFIRIRSSDKIKSVVPAYIQQEYGLAAAYGNTGSSSIGDEIKAKLIRGIDGEYRKKLEGNRRKKPSDFLTVREIADMAYQIMIDIKHQHVNDEMLSKLGFTSEEFIQGFYERKGVKFEIKDRDVIEKAYQHISWDKRGNESQAIFGNAAIVAGYDEREGFSIFHISQMEQFLKPVDKFFITDGSGREPTNLVFADFVEGFPAAERNSMDRVEGLFASIAAVQFASHRSIGVGGYFHIKYIDGRMKDNSKKMIDIDDSRAKLASELVTASSSGLLGTGCAMELLDRLIFQSDSPETVNREMWKESADPDAMRRLLRGYKI